MRKGKGELTYSQLWQDYDRAKRELSQKDAALVKAENELRAMTIAHNKLLKGRTPEKGE